MKLLSKFSFIFLIIIQSFHSLAQPTCSQKDPLLAVLIMVKNEADVMERTLLPYLDAGLKHFLVLDTGSTDETVEVTKQIFEAYDVHGFIVEQPFVDFATSRNYAIDCGEELFPEAKFFLMIDAEWYLNDVPGLIDFCKLFRHFPATAYLMCLHNNHFSKNYLCRLWKPNHGIRFEGVVHEYLNKIGTIKVPEEIYFNWDPTERGNAKTHKRFYRDIEILLKEHEKHPHDPRTLFYLGQSYACVEDYKNAAFWYQKRSQRSVWDEEDFMTWYRLGDAYDHLNDWDQALYYYLKAYDMRPGRIEPLMKMANYYLKVLDFQAAFYFAKLAVDTPVTTDLLFVERIAYDFDRYNILGIAAWYVGEYEVGEQAVLQALQHSPNATHLHFNLSLYEGRKGT
ncbi:MAG: tetratricopeptide repeat protein [Candidatus Dependentiae bacterium]|nr:tetratricopeptide repeat protein [Candidatus Dependentiae bacterium]